MRTDRTRYHIGLIPDGNRRWATERGLAVADGHQKGAEKVELFVDWFVEHPELSEATIYGLSEENFTRPDIQLRALYDIYDAELKKLIDKESIHRNRVRINVISTRSEPLPRSLLRLFDCTRNTTRGYDQKTLNLLIGYAGQAEILRSISSPANRIKNLLFGLKGRDLQRSLDIKTSCDFVVRTEAGEKKREAMSGFLLWQCAYAEYYHLDKLFPDVAEEDFEVAWRYFTGTRRKKGA
jgi:undecaprenyl diphosphate synthase